MAIHIEIQLRKFMKPGIPTPLTLSRYKISSLDEIALGVNISVVLFFSIDRSNTMKFVGQLEKSLEKTLPRFYLLLVDMFKKFMLLTVMTRVMSSNMPKLTLNLNIFLVPK